MSRRDVRDSDETRFTDLLTEVGPELLAYFQRRVGDESADLLAEVMMTAWKRYADLPNQHEQARMWLFGIARNVLANNYRSTVRRHRLADALRDSASATVVMEEADRVAIRDLIERLEPELAEVVTLLHWEGLTLSEISLLQGVPSSTVRNRYQRAKRLLRESFASLSEHTGVV